MAELPLSWQWIKLERRDVLLWFDGRDSEKGLPMVAASYIVGRRLSVQLSSSRNSKFTKSYITP